MNTFHVNSMEWIARFRYRGNRKWDDQSSADARRPYGSPEERVVDQSNLLTVPILFPTGAYEPNDEECEWSSEEEDEDELTEEMKKAKLENEKKSNDPAVQNVKGVPEFWLTIFKNVDMLQDMVQDHDEEPLKSLNDIKVVFMESPMVGSKSTHFCLDSLH